MERIFVGIPSYRDPECKQTINDLYSKAKNPDCIFVGVYCQFDEKEDNECLIVDVERINQVSVKSSHWSEAKGPCFARYMVQQLWRGEEYYLQIDSHTRFVNKWDEKLINYLKMCKNPAKSILTTYPVGYTLEQPNPTEKKPPAVVADRFDEKDQILRLKGKLLAQTYDKPIPSLFWVAGFSFSRSSVITQVPYDPHLLYLFFGEEALMNVRLWTHGWDFYLPGESIVYHLWERNYRHTFQEAKSEGHDVHLYNSSQRVKYLLKEVDDIEDCAKADLDKYGLGTFRTLDEFQKHTGIHFKNKIIDLKAKQGGLDPHFFVDFLIERILQFKQ